MKSKTKNTVGLNLSNNVISEIKLLAEIENRSVSNLAELLLMSALEKDYGIVLARKTYKTDELWSKLHSEPLYFESIEGSIITAGEDCEGLACLFDGTGKKIPVSFENPDNKTFTGFIKMQDNQ